LTAASSRLANSCFTPDQQSITLGVDIFEKFVQLSLLGLMANQTLWRLRVAHVPRDFAALDVISSPLSRLAVDRLQGETLTYELAEAARMNPGCS
jgi:hypothetical protein